LPSAARGISRIRVSSPTVSLAACTTLPCSSI
jgi:hypothetical protein